MRWVAGVALTAAVLVGAAPAAHAGPAGCPGQGSPPPPAAAEEGAGAPALPVPAEPVGGPRLGTCGDLVAGGAPVPPEVGVAAFVVADLDSGAVLAVRAPHARHRPASTIKVLTALVALRDLDPDLVVDGTAEDLRIEGSRAGIGPGGRYTVRLLLEGMLLNSGNDTAAALARALGGDAAAVAAMARTAAAAGALDTRPVTPSGLDGPGAATSAYDLALLFRMALRDPLFAATIRTRSVAFPGYADMPGFELSNSSRFLTGYPGALGGKTGFTDAARHTFVGAAERDGRRLVVALVRGEQSPVPMTAQTAALLDLGFALPADVAPLGMLVDAAPAAATASPAEPTTAPPEPAPATPPRPGSPPGLAVGAITAVALVALVLLARRPR
ncbi:serine hydrolase [Pseudonocardia sp.]|uniref:D-alanyl-D-alanine carboxypeptidase family protein n=1 Tax=Pseudonocardia sp. TaxID=60912 RepID=UPI00262723E9|nr:serine hydrolase [Pseudonocardia sp.]